MKDWTQSEDGRSNSSETYNAIVNAVSRLILESAHSLIRGDADGVARLIVSQLAHVHGLAPNGCAAQLDAWLKATKSSSPPIRYEYETRFYLHADPDELAQKAETDRRMKAFGFALAWEDRTIMSTFRVYRKEVR